MECTPVFPLPCPESAPLAVAFRPSACQAATPPQADPGALPGPATFVCLLLLRSSAPLLAAGLVPLYNASPFRSAPLLRCPPRLPRFRVQRIRTEPGVSVSTDPSPCESATSLLPLFPVRARVRALLLLLLPRSACVRA